MAKRKKKNERDIEIAKMTKEKDELFARMADIYKIIGRHDVKLEIDQKEMADFYEPVVKDILQYFLDNELRIGDMEVLSKEDILIAPMRQIASVLSNSLLRTIEVAQEKKWEKPFGNVTFKEIHDLLLK